MSTDISFNQMVITHPITLNDAIIDSELAVPDEFILALELLGNNRCFEQKPGSNKERIARDWNIIGSVTNEQTLLNFAQESAKHIETRMFRCNSIADAQGYVSRWKNRYRNAYHLTEPGLNLADHLRNFKLPIIATSSSTNPCAERLIRYMLGENFLEPNPNRDHSYLVRVTPETWSMLAVLLHSGEYKILGWNRPFDSVYFENLTPARVKKLRSVPIEPLKTKCQWIYQPELKMEALNTPAPAQTDDTPLEQAGIKKSESLRVIVNSFKRDIAELIDYDSLSRRFSLPMESLPVGHGIGSDFLVEIDPSGTCRLAVTA
jgi:hypothetical protein